MRTWDAITARRDVRESADEDLTREQLRTILEAGRRVTVVDELAAMGLVTDRDQLQRLSEV